jgi:hypothetical protein
VAQLVGRHDPKGSHARDGANVIAGEPILLLVDSNSFAGRASRHVEAAREGIA